MIWLTIRGSHYQYQNCSLDPVFWYTANIQYSFSWGNFPFWITNLWLTTWPLSTVCLRRKVRARFQLRVESWLHCVGTFRPWSTSNDMFGSPLADPWLENLRESSVFTPLSPRTSSANWKVRFIQYSLVALYSILVLCRTWVMRTNSSASKRSSTEY